MRFPYSTAYFPPAPSIDILLAAPGRSFQVGPVPAFVDTGADGTIVPLGHITPLQIQVDDRKYLISPWGERRRVDAYLVDVGIGGVRLPTIEIVVDEAGDEVILGRNVLNRLIVTLNGPAGTLELIG